MTILCPYQFHTISISACAWGLGLGLGPGLRPRFRTRPQAKAQVPGLGPKLRRGPGPKPKQRQRQRARATGINLRESIQMDSNSSLVHHIRLITNQKTSKDVKELQAFPRKDRPKVSTMIVLPKCGTTF